MAEFGRLVHKSITMGDAAVDGLLDGFPAGIGMAVLLTLAGFTMGETPDLLLSRFDPSVPSLALRGLIMHLAVSAVYGTAFGMISYVAGKRMRVPGALTIMGIIFGLLLFLLAEAVVLPASHSALAQLPLWDLILAHLAYGSVLGFLMDRAYKR